MWLGRVGEGKPHLARWKWKVQNVHHRKNDCAHTNINIFFFIPEVNNNGSSLGYSAKRGRCNDVKRVSLCFVSWVLLIITAPLEPRGELTFDPNKSGRTDAVRLVRLLLCWLKRMKACLDTAASDRIRLSSGPMHYCSHSSAALIVRSCLLMWGFQLENCIVTFIYFFSVFLLFSPLS